ncbi:hypothetical protein G9J39_002859 [Salmonella enterica]|nr:hypothetical protein [Salmonella enterica]
MENAMSRRKRILLTGNCEYELLGLSHLLAGMGYVKRGELFKIDLQLIQDNQKRHNGELFKIKSAVV